MAATMLPFLLSVIFYVSVNTIQKVNLFLCDKVIKMLVKLTLWLFIVIFTIQWEMVYRSIVFL
jgi:hypothetical protein